MKKSELVFTIIIGAFLLSVGISILQTIYSIRLWFKNPAFISGPTVPPNPLIAYTFMLVGASLMILSVISLARRRNKHEKK